MVKRAATLVLILWTCGCTTWVSHPTRSLAAIMQAGPPKVRIRTVAAGRVLLVNPVLTGDTLFGVERTERLHSPALEARHAVAINEIMSVETRQVNPVATVLLVGFAGGIALLVYTVNGLTAPGY